MKKLIAALTIMLAFTINANAQDKKSATAAEKAKSESINKQFTAVEKAKKEATELTLLLGLSDTQNADFYRLFEQKHRTLESNLTPERKAELARVIEAKIRASLDENQMGKLEKNPELLQKLIN